MTQETTSPARHHYPLFVTDALDTTKAFYLAIGFSVRYDRPNYLQVSYDEIPELELCFMRPTAGGPLTRPFSGAGVAVSIPTQSADEKCASLQRAGVAIASPITDWPWGWRSFQVADPNGVMLDFFHELPGAQVP